MARNPFNRGGGEDEPTADAQAEQQETAADQTGAVGPDEPTAEAEAERSEEMSEQGPDDRYAFEQDDGDAGTASEAGAAGAAGATTAAAVRNEPEGEAGGNGERYVGEDGAVLGKDFTIPGVDAEDDDPYRWHTGEKRDHGGEDAIEIIDLVKQFGRTRILNGLNLGLPDDQISMVLGPSGTGKSVLIKHIVGLLYPDSGDVLVHGESVPNMTDDELFEVRKKFGLLFQDGALFGSMNIVDNVVPREGPQVERPAAGEERLGVGCVPEAVAVAHQEPRVGQQVRDRAGAALRDPAPLPQLARGRAVRPDGREQPELDRGEQRLRHHVAGAQLDDPHWGRWARRSRLGAGGRLGRWGEHALRRLI